MANKLKIGEIVYRYVTSFPSAVFRFEVIGIRQYQDIEQYHVRCLSCNDHNACEMLIGYEGKNLNFIQMLNNRGDDYDEDRDESHWHNWGECFYKSREKAIFEKLKALRTEHLEAIEKAKLNLKNKQDNLIKLDTEIESHKLLIEKETR